MSFLFAIVRIVKLKVMILNILRDKMNKEQATSCIVELQNMISDLQERLVKVGKRLDKLEGKLYTKTGKEMYL